MADVSIQNYLSITTPTLAQAGEIAARVNGSLVLYKVLTVSGVEVQAEEIARANMDNIEIYQGGKNQSIVLDGYRTLIKTPKNVYLEGVVYRNYKNENMATTRTAVPDIYIEPGDTAIDGDNSFVVASISVAVGAGGSQMDIQG